MEAGTILLLALLASILIILISLAQIFRKAGEDAWKGLIPFVNLWFWLKIVGRPKWWIFLFFIPVVNILFQAIIIIDLLKCFRKFGVMHHLAALFFPFIYLPYLAFSKEEYIGTAREAEQKYGSQKTELQEWVDAIIFAVVAATVIRWFLIEAYTIPTGSMEKTLLVGDFLFVSKVNYGPRIPLTPLSFPLVHNTLPLIGGKSYVEWLTLPYYRIPGFEDIERQDIVVFNYPPEEGRPIDKKDNYIKRCVAIAGDTLEIRDRQLFINGILVPLPERSMFYYNVITDGQAFSNRFLREMGINEEDVFYNNNIWQMRLTTEQAEELRGKSFVKDLQPVILPDNYFTPGIFPFHKDLPWNVDNYGPLVIPKRGMQVEMTEENYFIYDKAIREYELNPSLEIKDSVVYLDGKPIDSYTFKMDYYFMVGDNRHNSMDSRMWGFVPENHVVGKPLFIFFSYDKHASNIFNGIRWGRMFNPITSGY